MKLKDKNGREIEFQIVSDWYDPDEIHNGSIPLIPLPDPKYKIVYNGEIKRDYFGSDEEYNKFMKLYEGRL